MHPAVRWSMEQAAVLVMQRVLAAESPDKRIHALVLGPVRTRFVESDSEWVSAAEVGAVAIALSLVAEVSSRTVPLGPATEARATLEAVEPTR